MELCEDINQKMAENLEVRHPRCVCVKIGEGM